MSITATYSPEDNKLRLYPSERLDAETFARVKEAGFKWAPKQGLFVAPMWTVAREDLAIDLAGDLEAEEMTLAERAAIKAERLDALAEKRNREAGQLARYAENLSQAFYMGQPILIGHHSERKARKTQERMQAATAKSAKAHEAANYWLYRAEGVEHFANMKNNPRVRAGRIKTLLAELRDLQRDINRAHNALAIWDKLQTDEQIRYALGRMDGRSLCASFGTYSDEHAGTITAQEARAKCMANAETIINGPNRKRWIAHVLNRLAYERSMLGPVPRYDGEITPVILQAFAREHGAEKPRASETDPGCYQLESEVPLPLHLADGTWMEFDCDGWRDVMQACGYTVPEKVERRKSNKPEAAPLINPTQEQAEALQALWNARMVESCKGKGSWVVAKPNEVKAITQAVYSANSKGTYSALGTVDLDAQGQIVRTVWRAMKPEQSAEPVARVRIFTGRSESYKPNSVVTITDKPQKALPFDPVALLAAITQQEQAA